MVQTDGRRPLIAASAWSVPASQMHTGTPCAAMVAAARSFPAKPPVTSCAAVEERTDPPCVSWAVDETGEVERRWRGAEGRVEREGRG